MSDGANIRTAQIMEVPKHFDHTHFRGITKTGRKFVYCPVGNICSWLEDDYNHEWCAWCGMSFEEVES